ncbi:MAG: DUF4347 domain-containing protein, partial [Pseudanabaenaceae cyanobacterium]
MSQQHVNLGGFNEGFGLSPGSSANALSAGAGLLYFVDTGVANYQSLVAGLPTDAQVIYIGQDENGVARIAEVLAGRSNLTGIHILAHGDDGTVHLGNTSLRSDNLGTYASLLQSWANALGVDADILFYGCNLAGSSAGKAFVDEIARLTGADVAASDNLTGHSLLGGDWYLEYQTGAIETPTLQVVDYQDTLFIGSLLLGGPPFYDWNPPGVGTQTFTNVDGSGVDVEITVSAVGGATPLLIDDMGAFMGGLGVTPLAAAFLPPFDGMENTDAGLDIMVSFFVTGTMSPLVVNGSNFVVTNIDARYTVPLSGEIQQFQDDVMITGPVAPTATADSGLTSQTMGSTTRVFAGEDTMSPMNPATPIGTEIAGANATISFSSPVNAFTIEFRDGPVPAEQSHGVGVLAGFMFDAPEVRLIGAPGTQLEGNSGVMLYVYTLGLTDSMGVGLTSSIPTTVTYSVDGIMPNSADATTDFAATTVATIPIGQTTSLVTVTVSGDTTPEFDETFAVMLTGSVFMLGGTTIATGTIINDDSPTIGFLNTTFTANEGNSGTTNFLFTITLSQSAPFPITVSFDTGDGTATSTSDYAAMMANAVFGAGQTEFVVTVPVSGDTLFELDETFTVTLSNATAPGVKPSVAVSQATGSIINDDMTSSEVSLVPGTVTQLESITAFVYTVSLSQTLNQPVVVTYQTNPGTAMAGDDFTGITAAVVTLNPGQSTVPVTVAVVDDMLPEGNEDFTVSLTGTNGTPGATVATGVIQDNDPLGVGLSGVLSATEPNAGTDAVSFVYSITLTQTAAQPVTVSFSTADGMTNPATSTQDYVGITNQTVVIPAGSAGVPVTVTVSSDTVVEPNEEFFVNLVGTPVSVTGLTVTYTGQTQATGIILNNDLPTVNVVPGTVSQLESITAFVYTVSLSQTLN